MTLSPTHSRLVALEGGMWEALVCMICALH
jgi:hypothetical protein